MANFFFNEALKLIMSRAAGTTSGAPYIDLETNSSGFVATNTNDAVRLLLTTTDISTISGVRDVEHMDALEALSGYTECSAGSYTNDTYLKNAVWKYPAATGKNYSYLEADDVDWGTIAASTTPIVGCVLWYGDANKTSDPASTDIPICYFDFSAVTDGGTLTMQWGSIAGVTVASGKGVVMKLTG